MAMEITIIFFPRLNLIVGAGNSWVEWAWWSGWRKFSWIQGGKIEPFWDDSEQTELPSKRLNCTCYYYGDFVFRTNILLRTMSSLIEFAQDFNVLKLQGPVT